MATLTHEDTSKVSVQLWSFSFHIAAKQTLLSYFLNHYCQLLEMQDTFWEISIARTKFYDLIHQKAEIARNATCPSQKKKAVVFTWFCIICGFIRLSAVVCLSLGHLLCRVLAWVLLPHVRYRGHRLLQHLDLIVLISRQQLLHVVILILAGKAMAEVCKPHEESQQSQGGQEAEALSCHDPGDYLQLRVPMLSPEEPAAAAGPRPINCSPSSPFPL